MNIYLAACAQPWRDGATIMLGTGMRPGEVFALRWEHIAMNGKAGLLQVTEGKSKAARRVLPMMPIVRAALEIRRAEQGKPAEGWVFPSRSASGHLERDSAKNQHCAALEAILINRRRVKGRNSKRFLPMSCGTPR